MLQPRSIQSTHNLRDKIFSIDYILVLAILVLGIPPWEEEGRARAGPALQQKARMPG